MNNNLAIIIPSYNEGIRLPQLVDKIRKVTQDSIVIIDDGSKEKVNLYKRKGIYSLRHRLNLGKGASLKTGIDFALKNGYKKFLLMDADLQHDPVEIPRFVKLSKNYDLVFGSRNLNFSAPLIRRLGNVLASNFIKIFFGIKINDILSGYRLINRKAYDLIKWESNGYAVETEMIARLARHKGELSYVELPIKAIYVDKYKGVNAITALKVLLDSLWWVFYIK